MKWASKKTRRLISESDLEMIMRIAVTKQHAILSGSDVESGQISTRLPNLYFWLAAVYIAFVLALYSALMFKNAKCAVLRHVSKFCISFLMTGAQVSAVGLPPRISTFSFCCRFGKKMQWVEWRRDWKQNWRMVKLYCIEDVNWGWIDFLLLTGSNSSNDLQISHSADSCIVLIRLCQR